jgi:excisionase family DNA binding protein
MDPTETQSGYLDKRSAAKYLDVSPRWIEDRLHEIPHYRPGGKILFRRSELDEWIEAYRVHPDDHDLQSLLDAVLSQQPN